MARKTLLLPLIALTLVTTLGGASAPPPPRPNVLLITLDTTRADYLSSYGFPYPTTPNLDALARRGVRFSDATTQIPLTGPSHATIMTGLYPHQHGAIRNGVPLLENVPTLAERFKDAGYRTAAFLSGWTLRSNLSGLARGFDVYDDKMEDRYRLVNGQRFAHQVTPLAQDWLRSAGGGPFFLWVHYFDPHSPYLKKDKSIAAMAKNGGGGLTSLPQRNRNYASELHHADSWIGKLLETLEETGRAENTMVVVVADHGEALGEHGYVGHGRRVHEEILRVPFILSWPGRLPAGRTVDVPVGMLDVAPTVLRMLDLPTLGEGMDLGPLMGPGEPPKHYSKRRIFFETYPGARKKFWRIFSPRVSVIPTLAGFREGSLKFIYDTGDEQGRVYDLASDRGETRDLMAHYATYQDSGMQLVQWIEDSSRVKGESAADDEDIERLRSLGYVD
jgi:arylsulfatase A-like enzyme